MSGSVSATGGTSAASAASGASSTDALGSLSSNFSSFLQLLMAQLQAQDPTSPMDTNQFTSELVQFTSVEQQINTNDSLKQLIQLTQGGEVEQATALLGHKVAAQSDHLSLQNGSATVQFSANTAGPVGIVVSDDAGNQIATASMQASAGTNSWTWNGQNSAGGTAADGAYRVTVTQNGAGGTATTLPTTIIGTATGVAASGQSVQLDLGSLPIDFSAIRSVTS